MNESIASMKKSAAKSAIESLLGQAGLRRTPVRVGVLQLLSSMQQPLDVPTIVGKLPDPTDAVTVYRTLNTFTRKKLVHRVRGEDRSWRYAMGKPSGHSVHQHPHFVCDECGKVDCLNDALVPNGFVRSLGIDSEYTVTYPEVVLHGRCPKCKED